MDDFQAALVERIDFLIFFILGLTLTLINIGQAEAPKFFAYPWMGAISSVFTMTGIWGTFRPSR